MYARRYGVDRYTAREDLEAIGFVFAPGNTRWSKRPEPVPRKPRADKDGGSDLDDWVWGGDRPMFVVGYTSGGVPYSSSRAPADRPSQERTSLTLRNGPGITPTRERSVGRRPWSRPSPRACPDRSEPAASVRRRQAVTRRNRSHRPPEPGAHEGITDGGSPDSRLGKALTLSWEVLVRRVRAGLRGPVPRGRAWCGSVVRRRCTCA
jgi:hypothetical protein